MVTERIVAAPRLLSGAKLDQLVVIGFAALVAAPLLAFVAYPVWSILRLSFDTPAGLGFDHYLRYFSTARAVDIVTNTFAVAITTSAITIVLAYGVAYAFHRSMIPYKGLFRLIVLIPLFAPSLVQAQGLVLLLGRNGIINRTFDAGIDIYGFWGIVIADVLYALPHAFLILSAALAVADARMYESATMLGASRWRIFWTVTLPSTKYGLMSAVFIVFTVAITDFGNPMVIGADFNVLATEMYNQVLGQANFERGTVIGVVLLIPAAVAVAVERRVSQRQYASISDQSRPLTVRPNPRFDAAMLGFTLLVCAAVLSVVGIVVFASFVHLWPYNMSFSLRHYYFDVQQGGQPLWNSIWVSLIAAVIGMAAAVSSAYLIHKFGNPATRFLYFLSILPAAVPGTVLGLGYILAFNDPANPLYTIYGTFLILAFCNVYHYHAQGFLISSTSIKQISATFDEASATLGAGFFRTMWKITVPLIWPTILSVGVFFFMRSMVTLAAVIFLFTPSTQLAAISVLLLEDRGATNQAAAFSVSIIAIVVGTLIAAHLLLRLCRVRNVELIR
ncbi:MAG: ABC transporter permease subunit [Kiloniellales bacterium]